MYHGYFTFVAPSNIIFIFPLLSKKDVVIEKIDSRRTIFFCGLFFPSGMCPLNVNQSKGFFLTMTFIPHINFLRASTHENAYIFNLF